MEHKITLLTGYTDDKGVEHRDVTFGRRVTAGDLMLLDKDPRSTSGTQYADLVRRRMITKFGSLKMPVSEGVLLKLDAIDREDLQTASDVFIAQSRSDRNPEFLPDNIVRLRDGFTIGEEKFTRVHFGRLTTGADEVEADGLQLEGVSRECFMIGRQIVQLGVDDVSVGVDGPVALDAFNSLDAEDLNLLRIGARIWRVSFRLQREALQGERDGESDVPTDAGDGNVGGANTAAAPAKA